MIPYYFIEESPVNRLSQPKNGQYFECPNGKNKDYYLSGE
jgi:hypothetical protein